MRVVARVAALCVVAVAFAGPALGSDAPGMTLTLLQEGTSGGRCLDGSMAGYYYAPPASGSSTTWVIYLQGGGACFSQATCSQRAKTPLGSSTAWPKQYAAGHAPCGDVCSPEAGANPDFHDAHFVFVPYCTGDVHTGARTSASPETWGYYFSGHLNLVAIVQSLLQGASTGPALKAATHVLLTGASAGGLGTFANADWLGAQLPWVPAGQYRASPVAGWFFPGDAPDEPNATWAPPSDWPHWSKGEAGGIGHNASITELWQSMLHPACAKAQPAGMAWRCESVHVLYPHIATPLFVQQNMYDTNQLFAQLQAPQNFSDPQLLDYVRYFGEAMRASTSQVVPANGMFLASCLDHVAGLGVGGSTQSGTGLNATNMLGDWFWQRNQLSHMYVDACKGAAQPHLPCNPSCTGIPTSGGCQAELTKVCPGLAGKDDSQCLMCANAHRAQLQAAGCTVAVVKAACKSGAP